MDESKLGAVESRFADLIWQNAPIGSGALVKLAERELGWKKSTTYTMLRRLCQRGLFENANSVVTTVVTRDEFYARQSQQFVQETFQGSLPAFLTAFTSQKRLSDEEVLQLEELIRRHRR